MIESAALKVTRLVVVLVGSSMCLWGCSPGAPVSDTTQTPVSTVGISTPTTTDGPVVEWVLQPALATLPSEWTHVFTIPFGDDVELLGSAPGGDNLMLGPDYGAQAPDGTWWFLDAAKQRLAHFDPEGSFLDKVVLGEEFLVSGIYFQYQLPRVLADGTLVATRFSETSTQLLLLREGEPDLVDIPAVVFARTDDGTTLYGFDDAEATVAIDPVEGSAQPTDWFRTQSGARYLVTLSTGEVTIELPDIAVTHVVPLVSSTGPGEIHAAIELATGADGSIHLYVLGISETDEQVQLAGYTAISEAGELRPMEPSVDPFTPADPGSPSHLGIAYGSSTPWLMIVGEQGLEVYSRS